MLNTKASGMCGAASHRPSRVRISRPPASSPTQVLPVPPEGAPAEAANPYAAPAPGAVPPPASPYGIPPAAAGAVPPPPPPPPPPGAPGYVPGAYGGPAPAYGTPGYAGAGYGYAAPVTSQNGVIALVLALASWVVCPLVLAVIALVLAAKARTEIDASGGRVTGDGLVTAAKVIAWINIALSIIAVVFFVLIIVFGLFAASTVPTVVTPSATVSFGA